MTGIIAAAGISAAAGLAGAGMQMLNKPGGGMQGQMSQQQLPQWYENGLMQNWSDAKDAAYNLMKPYPGDRVAGMTPEQQALIQQLYGNVGSTNPAFAQAGAATNALMGFNPSMVNPALLRDTNLAPYTNPYLQGVINPTMQLMEQSRRQALGQIGDQATQARAFGGSRQGIAEGVTNAQSELQKGGFAANLYGQNFLQGQAAATGDIQRDLQAQQSNQQYGLLGAQFRGNMANQSANLATQGQNNWLTGVQAAMGGQQMLTAQQQAQLDAARQYYEEQRQYPLQQLQIKQNALAGSPYSTTSYQQGAGPTTNPFLTGLGTAASTAGLLGQFGMFNKTSPYGTTSNPATIASPEALNAWNNSLGPLSDRRLKTDIRKVGRDKATDIDLYAYRYKGDPKTYPLVVGPMAQDVAKKYPDAVFKAGPYLGIKTNFLSGMAA